MRTTTTIGSRRQWEYRCVNAPSLAEMHRELLRLDKEGWQFGANLNGTSPVQVLGRWLAFLRRPKIHDVSRARSAVE